MMNDDIERLVKDALNELTSMTPLINAMHPRDDSVATTGDERVRRGRDIKALAMSVGVVALLAVLVVVGIRHQASHPSHAVVTAPTSTVPTTGSVTVKNVIGRAQVVAASTLGAEGLNIGQVVIAPSIQFAAGTVISTDPPAGSTAKAGSSVSLTVSSGSTTTSVPQAGGITVPNLIGMTTYQAISALQAVGLTNSINNVNCHDSMGKGTVVGQSPSEGFRAAPDNRINLAIACRAAVTPTSGPQGGSTP